MNQHDRLRSVSWPYRPLVLASLMIMAHVLAACPWVSGQTPQPTPAQIAQGKSLCERADRLVKESKAAEALAIYREVLTFLPESPRAKEGVRRCEMALQAASGKAPDAGGAVGQDRHLNAAAPGNRSQASVAKPARTEPGPVEGVVGVAWLILAWVVTRRWKGTRQDKVLVFILMITVPVVVLVWALRARRDRALAVEAGQPGAVPTGTEASLSGGSGGGGPMFRVLQGHTQPGDEARGIVTIPIALRWNGSSLSKEELRTRAMHAVQTVDRRYNKDVMDVKLLEVSAGQQYVQLTVRANFSSEAEMRQMVNDLKREFGEIAAAPVPSPPQSTPCRGLERGQKAGSAAPSCVFCCGSATRTIRISETTFSLCAGSGCESGLRAFCQQLGWGMAALEGNSSVPLNLGDETGRRIVREIQTQASGSSAPASTVRKDPGRCPRCGLVLGPDAKRMVENLITLKKAGANVDQLTLSCSCGASLRVHDFE